MDNEKNVVREVLMVILINFYGFNYYNYLQCSAKIIYLIK